MQSRFARRRAAAIQSLKVLLTAGALSATLGGWAALSAAAKIATQAAPAVAANNVSGDSLNSTAQDSGEAFDEAEVEDEDEDEAAATPAPTATAVPRRTPQQPPVRSRSSR